MDYVDLKRKAILLRQKGATYSEVLKKVPVAKSTLSLWLRSVGLANEQRQRITEKRRIASCKAGETRRDQRISLTRQIVDVAKTEIGSISRRDLFLIGVSLYWAEGSKEKEYKPGTEVRFSNSDPFMINVFLKWLSGICGINKDRITFEIYIHESYKNNLEQVKSFWSLRTAFPKACFDRVCWKKHPLKTNRKNIGNMYNGVLRIRVKASSKLLRKIQGWTLGICSNL